MHEQSSQYFLYHTGYLITLYSIVTYYKYSYGLLRIINNIKGKFSMATPNTWDFKISYQIFWLMEQQILSIVSDIRRGEVQLYLIGSLVGDMRHMLRFPGSIYKAMISVLSFIFFYAWVQIQVMQERVVDQNHKCPATDNTSMTTALPRVLWGEWCPEAGRCITGMSLRRRPCVCACVWLCE